MKLSEVKETVKQIGELSEDFEAAHCVEDALYEAVLRQILHCKDLDEAKRFARAALKTQKLDFDRYCA